MAILMTSVATRVGGMRVGAPRVRSFDDNFAGCPYPPSLCGADAAPAHGGHPRVIFDEQI